MHMHLDTDKKVKACCHTFPIDDSDTIDYNSDTYKRLRHNSLNQIPNPECSRCNKMEQEKVLSPRMSALKDLKNHKDLILEQIEKFSNGDDLEPYYYDLRISNNCNLACIMCNYKYSSTIGKEQGVNDPHLSFEVDIPINPNAIMLYFAGGEPFMIKKFVKFLQDCNNTDCKISIVTNGTIITEPLLNELKRFKKVLVTISLDGYDELNGKIRRHSRWNDIDKNIDVFLSLGFDVIVNTTVQRDNLFHLSDLRKYIEQKGIKKWNLSTIYCKPNKDELHWINAIGELDSLQNLFNNLLIKKNFMNIRFLNTIIEAHKKKHNV